MTTPTTKLRPAEEVREAAFALTRAIEAIKDNPSMVGRYEQLKASRAILLDMLGVPEWLIWNVMLDYEQERTNSND